MASPEASWRTIANEVDSVEDVVVED